MTDALTRPAPSALDRPRERGKENITADDVTLPRIAIAQKTSAQLEPDKPEYIAGLKLFQLFNTATKDVYGAGPIEFVVVRLDKRRMQFDANNNVVDHDVPAGDPRLEFTTGPDGQRLRPIATLFYDFLVILDVEPRMPAVLSLKGTGVKTARHLNNLLKMRRGDAWLQKFSLTATKDASGSFTYGAYVIQPAGPTPDDLQTLAEQTYEDLLDRRLDTDRDTGDVIDQEGVPF